ncbi:hypothetical protein ABZ470_39775 [Streptosporangium sp. NPDC020072]|uniref:hypothetical protein n=1 Tax=Streptosporangium sp. NPDC020072 TaxID=3154788 RepID=UPI0034182401
MNDEGPHYIDDPLVDRTKHRLEIHEDPRASKAPGYKPVFGTCSCGEWVTPTWDVPAVMEFFDQHMRDVQKTARRKAEGR